MPRAQGAGDELIWWSLALSVMIALSVTVAVNRRLITRERCRAVVHELH